MCTIGENTVTHYSGNRHYSAYCQQWLCLSLPSDFTGAITGNRHYRGTTTAVPFRHAPHVVQPEQVIDHACLPSPPPPVILNNAARKEARACWKMAMAMSTAQHAKQHTPSNESLRRFRRKWGERKRRATRLTPLYNWNPFFSDKMT